MHTRKRPDAVALLLLLYHLLTPAVFSAYNQAEDRLNLEQERVTNYLHSSTEEKLLKVRKTVPQTHNCPRSPALPQLDLTQTHHPHCLGAGGQQGASRDAPNAAHAEGVDWPLRIATGRQERRYVPQRAIQLLDILS